MSRALKIAAVIILVALIWFGPAWARRLRGSRAARATGRPASSPALRVRAAPRITPDDVPAAAPQADPEDDASVVRTVAPVAPPPCSAAVPPPPPSPPAPTPAPEAALQLAATGYGTGSTSPRWLGFSLILHNTHPTLAAAHARYQAAAYDASGAVLQTESGYIELVLPGHRLGASDTMLLGEGQTAARVEVHISPPRMVEPQGQQPLGVENIAIVEEGFGVRAAGLVTNAYDRDLRDVRVSAVPYDAQGNIIGGGFTYLDIIPAGAQAPVSVDLISPGRPARVELYPMPTILSR